MTPKGLLRLKDAASSLDELAEGAFQPLIDASPCDKPAVRRLVLCTGKVYYDIVGHEAASEDECIAVARIEQLYPFPVEAAHELVSSYPQLDEVVWAQEEPQNMGAWRTIRHRLEEAAGGVPSATSAAPGAPAPPRATRPRMRSSRSGSCVPRSTLERLADALRLAAALRPST